jgi:tetratricopeptide (TPR) repeat protein
MSAEPELSDDEVLSLADKYAFEGRLESALELFRQRLMIDPFNAKIHKWIYGLLLGPDQGRGLVEFYRDIQKNHPEDWRHLVNLGRAYSRTGKDSLAVVQLQKLLRSDSSLLEVWMDLAHCYLRLEKTELALRALNSLIELHPEHAQAHVERVRLLARAREFDEAAASAVFSLECKELPAHVREWLEEMDLYLEAGQAPSEDLILRLAEVDQA